MKNDAIEKIESLARSMKITTSRPFRCILPGHPRHQARLDWDEHRRYRCKGLDHDGIGLAEVRAALARGEVCAISTTEAARWRDLLGWESGLRITRLTAAVPDDAPPNARIVQVRMTLLVDLRDGRWPISTPAIFTGEINGKRGFGAAYTGLTVKEFRGAIGWLEQHRLVERAGKRERAILWHVAVACSQCGRTTLNRDLDDTWQMCGDCQRRHAAVAA